MHQAVNCVSAGVLLAAGPSGGNLAPYDVRCDSLWCAQSLGCLKHSAGAIRLGRNACNDHVAELIPCDQRLREGRAGDQQARCTADSTTARQIANAMLSSGGRLQIAKPSCSLLLVGSGTGAKNTKPRGIGR
jgi:hypothetical protein